MAQPSTPCRRADRPAPGLPQRTSTLLAGVNGGSEREAAGTDSVVTGDLMLPIGDEDTGTHAGTHAVTDIEAVTDLDHHAAINPGAINPGAVDAEADAEAEADTLEAIAERIDAAAAQEHAAAATVRELAAERRKGRSWMHLAERGALRAALERIGNGVRVLRGGAARIRRTAARGMAAEGASTRRIGALFGVSHQRVSSIMARQDEEEPGGPAGI